MSTVLRSFYHNLSDPVIIFSGNPTSEPKKVFLNKACSVFLGENPASAANGEIEDGEKFLKKLSYKFYFELCLIESENLKTYSPLIEAVENKGNYQLYGIYQKNEREFLYFIIQVFSLKKYRIVYFHDITKEIMLTGLQNENEQLKIQNQEFLNTNSKAQNQAVKMALLNRIATSISKTIDINDMLKTALKELSIIFGAKKVYFAKRVKGTAPSKNECFETEYIYPETLDSIKVLSFDKNATDEILDGKISILESCLKEAENTEPFKTPFTRIILPIMEKENLNAVIVILTAKKHIEDIEKELMVSISMQVSSAITQAMLFKAVSDKKEELEAALVELKETQLQLINSEKMASLGQLIASVAHEINTPIASICANNEILKRFFETGKFDSDTIEILKETNEIDAEAIKRIANLVQSLKRFVRLDEMVSQAANINEELDLTLNLLRHKLKKDIKLTKNYGALPLVECFPNMLNQVFLNILMNSIQSIEKQAEVENAGLSGAKSDYLGEIIISTDTEENNLVVSIQDNGAGIKEEDKKKIFQAGFTTKKVGEGTGLGLAICKKIIEKHNGEISFESTSYKLENPSRIAKSTIFKIKLPL